MAGLAQNSLAHRTRAWLVAQFGTLPRALATGTLMLVALMPFHAAIVVVIGSWNGHPELLAAWKEALIVVLGLIAVAIVTQTGSWRRLSRPIPLAILIISALGLAISLINHVSLSSLAFGTKTDLFPWFLFLAALWAHRPSLLSRRLEIILIGSGLLVSLFAWLEIYVLPVSLLERLGYGPATIIPQQFIFWGVNATRAFSTLGGPNQLGAYLLVPLAVALVLAWRRSLWYLAMVPPIVFTLYMTYSRSAWIAAVVTVATAIFLVLPRKLRIITSLILLVGVATLGILGYQALQQTKITTLERILLHGEINRQTNMIEGSDVGRTSSLKQGLATLAAHPLGLGLGAAGPASYKTAHPLITENWYLQIGLEFGWLGLAAIMVLFGLIIWQLIRQSAAPGAILAPSLLAAFIGVLVCNLFLHSLADSTLSLVLCGSLGLVMDPRKVLGT